MIRTNFILALLLLTTILVACGGNSVSKPIVLQNAESYTADGLQAYADSDWNRAQRLFNRALSLYQGIDNQHGVLHSYINLAEVALSIRDYPSAKNNLDHATAIVKQVSLPLYQQRITLLYVQKALQQNQTALAESLLQPLLPKFDKDIPTLIPDIIQMNAIANRTKIAFAQKLDEQLWMQRYANALKMLDITNPGMKARLLRFQSSWMQSQGKYQESEFNLQRALNEYKKSLFRSGIAVTLSELGQLNMIQGRWQEAHGYLNRSIAVYLQLKDLDKVIQTAENLIKVESELGNLENGKALSQWLTELKDKKTNLPKKQPDLSE